MAAVTCAKRRKPIRKGQHVSTHTFARYAGVVDGRATAEPWLTLVVHLRKECMGLTDETVRAVLALRHRPVLVSAPTREMSA